MAMGLVRAGAEERDGLVPRAAAERVDGLGPDLPPVAPDVVRPGEPAMFDGQQELAGGGEVAVPLVDEAAADAAGPEAHDQDPGAVVRSRGVVDPLDSQHLFV